MKILEEYINSKNGDLSVCEDGFLIAENFIVLVDGATAKGKMKWQDGKHKGGYFAKEIILQTVNNFDKEITATKAIEALTKAIRKHYEYDFEHFFKMPEDRMEASVLIYSKQKNEVWAYGDCQLMINGKLEKLDKKLDQINSEARCLYNTILLESGHTLESLQVEDLGRELILPILKTQSLLSNKDCEYGFPVINGIDYNEKLIKTYKVKTGDEIVFASDGYPFLKDTLSKSEKDLERVLKEDPFMIKIYKSTKGLQQGNISYDDRSYIKFIAD